MLKILLANPEHSFKGKIRNVIVVYFILLIWLFLVKKFLNFVEPEDDCFMQLIRGFKYTFFFTCIWAPLWEEAAFRFAPLHLARHFGNDTLLPVIVISQVIFGWGHGSGPISVLVQGVFGFFACLLYIKNNYSYWSTVLLHFLWNLTTAIAIPLIQSNLK